MAMVALLLAATAAAGCGETPDGASLLLAPGLPACTPPSGSSAVWALASSCSFSGSVQFDTIKVPAGVELRVRDNGSASVIRVRVFLVAGALSAGSLEQPFRSKLDIVLMGSSSDQDNSTVPKFWPDPGLPMSKVLVVQSGGSLQLHGEHKTPWIKLARSAQAGQRAITLVQPAVGWVAGDRIALPSTGLVGQNCSEVATVLGVQGATVTLSSPLKHEHVGHYGDVRLNGEAGILSRNIRITGDNTNEQHAECVAALAGSFTDEANVLMIRSLCYGGHTVCRPFTL